MSPFYLFQCIKNHADRVRNSACKQECDCRLRHACFERFPVKANEPAHYHIRDCRKQPHLAAKNGVRRNACNRKSPDYAEKQPAAVLTQHAQAERRICARNQQINRRMVKNAEDFLYMVRRKRMIERAHKIKHYKHCTEKREACNEERLFCLRSINCRPYNKQHKRRN